MFLVNITLAAMGPWEILGLLGLGAVLIFLFMYPSIANKKRQKHIAELYSSVEVGDKIKTVGGIIATVIEVREISAVESEIVVETGLEGHTTTMVFDMQAVYQNLTKIASKAAMDSQEKDV